MKSFIYLVLICLTASTYTFSQTPKYPFPQNVKYPYGVMTTKVTSAFVKTWYDSWKKKYLQTCGSNTRPGVAPLDKSLVEAQGFSMVAVAYMGDKDVFDKLYAYYKLKSTTTGCGLMGWKTTCDGFVDQGAATDGDIDVACALVVASWQWPDGGYTEKVKAQLTLLKKAVTNCSGKLAVFPGCSGGTFWGGCSETDISYYSPAFFRYFAKISGDSSWNTLADDTHIIRDAAANATTGLVPDWQSVSGQAGAGSRIGYYSNDAMRAPYKQTLDFIWNGNKKAEAWCKKISSWAYGVGPAALKDGYQLNGSVQGSNHNMVVVGSLAVAAMANSQSVVDAFGAEVIKLKDDYWYCGYLGNLYLLAVSGNMWNPEIVNKVNSKRKLQTATPLAGVKMLANRQVVVSGVAKGTVISITTLTGQSMRETVVAGTDNFTVVDMSGIRHGCYVLRIDTGVHTGSLGRIVSIM